MFSSAQNKFNYFFARVCFPASFSPTHTSHRQTNTTKRCTGPNHILLLHIHQQTLSQPVTPSGSFFSCSSTTPHAVFFCCSSTFSLPTPSSHSLFDSFYFWYWQPCHRTELKVNKSSFLSASFSWKKNNSERSMSVKVCMNCVSMWVYSSTSVYICESLRVYLCMCVYETANHRLIGAIRELAEQHSSTRWATRSRHIACRHTLHTCDTHLNT